MPQPPERWLAPLAACLLLLGVTATGCRKKPPPSRTHASALAKPSAAAVPSLASTPAVPVPSGAQPDLVSSASAAYSGPCRAMRVTGSVRTASGRALSTQSTLDGREWLEIGKHSELVVRHGRAARELSLHGPGRFLPCRSGLEQVLIAEGTLRSSPGSGVRPGAEVWVATPFGAARYADADLEVTSARSSLELKVRGGQVFIEAAVGLRGAKDGRLTGPKGEASVRRRPDPAALVSACERAARAAEESAQRLLAAKPPELGQLAATQLRSRGLARGQCLVAEAGAAQVEDPAKRSRLGDQLKHFEALWQGIPAQPTGAPPARR